MNDSGFLAVFLVGLLGGVHCAGMCGGIVSALSLNLPAPSSARAPAWLLHLSYNLGRILSYGLAGAAMGALGSVGLLFDKALPVQMTLYVLANLMMIALGAYLIGMQRSMAWVERAGQRIWRRLQPLTRRFLPVRGPAQAFPLGMLWGWLPCGMVYSMLALALLTGSAARGAATLLVFGLGTLPNLMLAGLVLVRFRTQVQRPAVRLGAGLLVGGFGVWGLANAATLGGRLWQGVVCHV